MDVVLALPTAIEGNWILLDADGNTVAQSKDHPGAQLVVKPFFYRNQQTQTVARATVVGSRGKRLQQALKISGSAGMIKAEKMGVQPKPIVPGFDKAGPTKDDSKNERKQSTASTGSAPVSAS